MDLLAVLPFVLILAVFWLFLIRPQQRRQREQLRMQSELTVGLRVMLTSGVFGTIRRLTDDRAWIEVSEGAELEVVRAAIATVDADASTPVDPTAEQGPDETGTNA